MHSKSFHFSYLAFGLITALSGCIGGGTTPTVTPPPTGGGGGSNGGTPISAADFDANNLDYIFAVPTTQPVTGTASYVGKVSLLTLVDATEAVYGDANMSVNFGAGVTNPVTGTIGNFAGKVNGVDTAIAGTLSTANAVAGDPNFVTSTVTGAGTLTGFNATFRGDLTDPTTTLSGNARMILGVNLKEAGGAKISGGHQTTITPAGGGTTIATSGSIYADKQ